MEIVSIPIAVNVTEVKNVFGSKNRQLFETLIETKTFKRYDKQFGIKKELRNIIFNYRSKEQRSNSGFSLMSFLKIKCENGLNGKWENYGYALLVICDFLGKNLANNGGRFFYGKDWWRINTLLREKGSKIDLNAMLRSRQIFDTPFEEGKIFNNYYDINEVHVFLKSLESIDIHVEEDVRGFYDTIKQGFLFCANNNCEWVSFSYRSEKQNLN